MFDSKPNWEWMLDENDRSVYGLYDIGRRGTRDFKSMKPSILRASLEDAVGAFHALSDGSHAVRMEVRLRTENVIMDTDQADKPEKVRFVDSMGLIKVVSLRKALIGNAFP